AVRWLLLATVLATVVVTVAADLEGAAAAIGLMTGMDWRPFVVPVAVGMVVLLTVGTYDEVERVLRYVMLSLLAYVVAALLAHVDWSAVARESLVPHFHFDSGWTGG